MTILSGITAPTEVEWDAESSPDRVLTPQSPSIVWETEAGLKEKLPKGN